MEKITEYCPYCNDETEIEETGAVCSYCGHFLKPCSLCDMDKVKCNECPSKIYTALRGNVLLKHLEGKKEDYTDVVGC